MQRAQLSFARGNDGEANRAVVAVATVAYRYGPLFQVRGVNAHDLQYGAPEILVLLTNDPDRVVAGKLYAEVVTHWTKDC